MIIKKYIYCLVLLVLLTGCKVLYPDQFKYEIGMDDRGNYNGMKTGFSWNLPQPK